MIRLLLGVALFAHTQVMAQDMTAALQKTEAGRVGSTFVTTLTFDNPVSSDQAMIAFQNGVIQIDLAGMTTSAKREVSNLADKLIRSVSTYQAAPDILRTRIALQGSTEAASYKGRVQTESINNVLRITLKDEGETEATATKEEEAAVDAQVEEAMKVLPAKVTVAVPPNSVDEELAQEMGIRKIGSVAKPAQAENTAVAPATGLPETAAPEGDVSLEHGVEAQKPAGAETASSLGIINDSEASRSESDIPLFTKAVVAKGASTPTAVRLGLSLLVVLCVAGGLMLFAKYWAKRKTGLQPHMQIKVLTQYSLGPKKNLAIVRVAGESILIGVTDHNITLIKSLALMDEDMPDEVPNQFASELLGAGMREANILAPPPREVEKITEISEDFSFGTVKDLVASRLNGMRSI